MVNPDFVEADRLNVRERYERWEERKAWLKEKARSMLSCVRDVLMPAPKTYLECLRHVQPDREESRRALRRMPVSSAPVDLEQFARDIAAAKALADARDSEEAGRSL